MSNRISENESPALPVPEDIEEAATPTEEKSISITEAEVRQLRAFLGQLPLDTSVGIANWLQQKAEAAGISL